jgi:hypothetical protein
VEQVLAMNRELVALREQVAALQAGEGLTGTPVPTPTPQPSGDGSDGGALAALTAERDALAAQLALTEAGLAETLATLERITLGAPVVVRTGSGGATLAAGQTSTIPIALLTGQTLRATITCSSAATACQAGVLTPDGRTALVRSFLGATALTYTNLEPPGTHLLTVQASGGANAYSLDYEVTDGYAR